MSRRPRIGITVQTRQVDTAPEFKAPAYTVSHNDVDGVRDAGGVPVLLVPIDGDLGVLLDQIEGLVLTGGGDIGPDIYGGAVDETTYGVDSERDAFEIALALGARERNMPVLAICRGLQVVNVALGGTLIGDIPKAVDGTLTHWYRGDEAFQAIQQVRLEEGCRLSRLLGQTELAVNSSHHQAVDRLADGLRAVGWAEDGVIEALEPEDLWPLTAVQWHPERLSSRGDLTSKKLYAALVEAASAPWNNA